MRDTGIWPTLAANRTDYFQDVSISLYWNSQRAPLVQPQCTNSCKHHRGNAASLDGLKPLAVILVAEYLQICDGETGFIASEQ